MDTVELYTRAMKGTMREPQANLGAGQKFSPIDVFKQKKGSDKPWDFSGLIKRLHRHHSKIVKAARPRLQRVTHPHLAFRGLGVLAFRGLHAFAFRGPHVLAIIGLHALTFRGLHSLAFRGLHALAFRGLHVLTFKGLYILAFRGLHVLAFKGLHICAFRELKVLRS
ncbi:hypothetical protein JHK86_010187 [Glycine max]|nr:hypothetical protein JHK86_010187 [Glycine max]